MYLENELSLVIHVNAITGSFVFILTKWPMCQLYISNKLASNRLTNCVYGSVPVCSVQPLTNLRTHQKLQSFLSLPSSLSPLSSCLCIFMKQIHLKHFQLTQIRLSICATPGKFSIDFRCNRAASQIHFVFCLNR